MALKLVQTAGAAAYSYDMLDSELSSLKGGEILTLTSVAVPGSDKSAYDSADGYVNPSGAQKRTVATKTLTSGKRPLMLADDGVVGYGTLFGTVVGGTVGQQVTGGAVLGPHTALASGKVSCWYTQGLYAVSLDAVDTNASTGLVPTNTSIDAGSPIYATSAGLLTPTSGSAFETVAVGRFVEFQTSGSLVTTPSKLVSALNSPVGAAATTQSYSYALFYYYGL